VSAAASWLAAFSPAFRPCAPRACGRIRRTADGPDRSGVTCCRHLPGVPCDRSEAIKPTADSSASKEIVTAALLLVIGGKILNIGYIAEYLKAVGIDLKEVR
jgi:hypothetical protein